MIKQTALALSVACIAPLTLSAQSIFSESFDGSIPANFLVGYSGSWTYDATDFDGTGGSAISQGNTYTEMGGTALSTASSAGAFNFSFYLDVPNASSSFAGNRVIFLSVADDTASGFGMHYGYDSGADTFSIFARVGTQNSNAETPLVVSAGSLIEGSVVFDTVAGTGNITITSSGQSVTLDSAANYGTLGNDISFRATAGNVIVDGINVTAVPEPAFYATALGLLALAFSASRKKKKRMAHC